DRPVAGEAAPMNDLKPGYQTTEFWSTLVGQVLGMLTVLGIVHASDAGALGQALSAGIIAFTNLIVVWKYIAGRTDLKKDLLRPETWTTGRGVLPFVVAAAVLWLFTPGPLPAA